MDRAEIVRGCSRSGVSGCACPVLATERGSSGVGGRGGVGWRAGGHPRCCKSVCERFAAFWAVPKISEKQKESMTIPLVPSEDEGSVFPISDTLSSKQSSGLDRQNVHGGRSCCLLCKKISD